jgi:hypothetical protein
MGHFNTIWQGDANALSLLSLAHASSPATAFNITGIRTLSVRETALHFGELFGKTPHLTGAEAKDALLSNPTRSVISLGPPFVSETDLIEWTAAWIQRGGATLGKPTHFESRDGRF